MPQPSSQEECKMAEYDLIVRNGTIVDGTGGIPAYRGDVAIKDGRIAMISGRIKATAMKEVDATGCIVAPGAIDLHNHYDLQLHWDWESFPQWMDSLAKRPLGVNVGALVPFNPLRLYVMGIEESRERVYATEAETRQMQALVHEAMKAGAFGWSSMKTLINRPDDGRFISSQVASNEEYLALAQVLADFGVGSIGWTRGAAERPLPPGEPDLLGGDTTPAGSGIQMDPVEGDAPGKGREDFLIEMCLASGRPLQWGAVSQSEVAPGRWKEQLAFLERAHAAGAWMYAQTASNPPSPVFELAEYNGFDAMPNWIDPFVGTPEERIAKLKQPGVRDRMRRDVGAWTGTGGQADAVSNWAKMRVVEVRHPRNFQYEGLTIAELAENTGKHPMDAMLD